ncbi:MAG: hypothetical protein AB2L14_19055 [Candidatus Xenobiia bacterium LiM19]
MMAIIVFISFLGYCALLSRRVRWAVELIPFFVISSMIALLYLSGLLSLLTPGAWILFIGGLLSLIIFSVESRKELRPSFSRLFTPGTALFTVCSVFIWFRFKGYIYNDWDEFAIWGHMVKDMLASQGLIGPESSMRFKDYPPGAALVQYYLSTFTGYSEGAAVTALNFTILCAITVFQSRVPWKKWPYSLLMMACGVLALLAWGRTFDTIYVDHLLGLFFGCAIASYTLAPAPRSEAFLRLLPTLCVIPLIKTAGIFLALVVCIFLWADAGMVFIGRFVKARKTLRQAILERLNGSQRSTFLSGAVLLILLTAVPFLSQGLWKARQTSLGIKKSWPATFSFQDVQRSFSEREGSPRERQIIQNFKKTLFTSDLSYLGSTSKFFRLTPRNGIIMLFLFSFTALLLYDDWLSRIRIGTGQIILFLGCILYIMGLLVILYLHYFNDEESVRLASFARYTATYYIGWSFVVLSLYQMALMGKQSLETACTNADISLPETVMETPVAAMEAPASTVELPLTLAESDGSGSHVLKNPPLPAGTAHLRYILPLAVMSFFVCAYCDVHHYEAPGEVVSFRKSFERQISSIRGITSPRDSIYIIWQNSPGAPKVMAAYELAPRKTNLDGWSLGKPYGVDDLWTVDKTAEEWEQDLAEYDYLLIGSSDEQFWNLYRSLFEDQAGSREHTFFKVIRLDEKSVKLRIME